jgi:hypothetical protein
MSSEDTQYLLDTADSPGIAFAGDLQDDSTSRTIRCREDNLLVSVTKFIIINRNSHCFCWTAGLQILGLEIYADTVVGNKMKCGVSRGLKRGLNTGKLNLSFALSTL